MPGVKQIREPDAEWLPKAAAAKLLGVATRQLERRTRQGFVESRREPRGINETTARVVYSRADIVALKAGTPNRHAREVVRREDVVRETENGEIPNKSGNERQSGKLAVTALARVPDADPFVGLAARFAGLAAFAAQYAPPPAIKPWLTLDEAVEYSGLTRAWLLKQAKACIDPANPENGAIRDMGKHTRGGRWRFHREALGGGDV